MMAVTQPVTSLSIRVPIEDVKAIQINGSSVKVILETPHDYRMRLLTRGVQLEDLGPFGRALLNKDSKERLQVLSKYDIFPNRQLPMSALDEFKELQSVRDLAAFTQKYGRLAPVDDIPLEFALQQKKQMEEILWINKSLAEENVEESAEDIEASLEGAKAAGLDLTSNPHDAIAFHITKHLALARVTMLPEPHLQPVVMCSTLLTGLYALLMNSVIEGQPYRICRCGRWFRSGNATKLNCSTSCQQAGKQKRYRDSLVAKKERLKARGNRKMSILRKGKKHGH